MTWIQDLIIMGRYCIIKRIEVLALSLLNGAKIL